MIDWIKFKGSTEEERREDINYNGNIILIDNKDLILKIHSSNIEDYFLLNKTHWAPLNLPQEEKWEREIDFNYSYEGGPLILSIHKEFDNIYSILNELRKR